MKIISCTSFGNSGSSVVTDILKEFSNVKNVAGSSLEFTFLHEQDGFFDLQKVLEQGNRLNTDIAIKRFICLMHNLNYNNKCCINYKEIFGNYFLEEVNAFLQRIGVIKWQYGAWHRNKELSINKDYIIHKVRFSKNLKKLKYSLFETDTWRPSFQDYDTMYYCCCSKENFIKETKVFLNNIFNYLKLNTEVCVFDQILPHTLKKEYFEYFDDIRPVLIDRDPRDLYFANKVFWGSGYIPMDNVEIFVNWYKQTRMISNNALSKKFQFEDFIYNYEDTVKKLCDYLNISITEWNNKKTYFDPAKSIKNTAIYKKYNLLDNNQKMQMENDIKYIEKELNDYLYPFEKFEQNQNIKQIDQNTMIFDIIEKSFKEKNNSSKNLEFYFFALPLYSLYSTKLRQTLSFLKFQIKNKCKFTIKLVLKTLIKLCVFSFTFLFEVMFHFFKNLWR